MSKRLGNGMMYTCAAVCAAFCCIAIDRNDERTGGAWMLLGLICMMIANAFLVFVIVILHLEFYSLLAIIVTVEFMLNFVGLLAIHHSSPYIERSEASNKKPIGRVNKFLIDIFALCIVILLRYSLECIWLSVAWILFVVEFQAILKLRYGARDLVFSDVLVGVILRLLVIYQKEKDISPMIVKILLCVLTIYHMHRSFLTTASAILIESQEGSEIKNIEAVITIESNL